MIEKRCKECGIIFTTDKPDQQICTLCEDDRKAEAEADDDYEKNRCRLRRYHRRYFNTRKGVIRTLYWLLLLAMDFVNEKLIRGCDNG